MTTYHDTMDALNTAIRNDDFRRATEIVNRTPFTQSAEMLIAYATEVVLLRGEEKK